MKPSNGHPISPVTHGGVIVPMVTPVTPSGALDERAVERLLAHLAAGGVHGVFVLGTTGEGPAVPRALGERLVRLTVAATRGRLVVYAGIGAVDLGAAVAAGNHFLRCGVDAVVAHAPARFETQPEAALEFFAELSGRLEGDLILYNMPLTTRVSLPIPLCKATAHRPRVIGIKDSENDAARMVELLRELGDKKDFAVFIGTGPLMGQGLLLGAEGIVPSVGNLAPALCRELYDAARAGDVARTNALHERLMAVSAIYQRGRSLAQSLAALKSALAWLGLCGPDMLPPLAALPEAERAALRQELLAEGFPVRGEYPAPVELQPVG